MREPDCHVRFGSTAAVRISQSTNVRSLVQPAPERTGSIRPVRVLLGGRAAFPSLP